jgi:hypothetical protein
MNRVKIDSTQIRLSIVLSGAEFVATWYGPGDKMWRPCMKIADRPIDILEENSLTAEAAIAFAETISKMERILEEKP